MKKLLLATLAMLAIACSSDDAVSTTPEENNPENPTPENPEPESPDCVFYDSVTLNTQAEVDAFAAHNYCKIIGGLYVGKSTTGSDISDLSGLTKLTEITGQFTIFQTQLVNLHGLENLQKVGELFIYYNQNLETLEHLTSLVEVCPYGGTNEKTLTIGLNRNLKSLKGLGQITTVQRLSITSNDALLNLEGLERLEKASVLHIQGNYNLDTFEGLTAIKEVGTLDIYHNDMLTSVVQLDNIEKLSYFYCGENIMLTVLPPMSKITELNELHIVRTPLISFQSLSHVTKILIIEFYENYQLSSLSGLSNLKTVTRLQIISSPALNTLSNFSSITSVIANPETPFDYYDGLWLTGLNITSLSGFQNITSFEGNIRIGSNANLTNFCAISGIVDDATTLVEFVDNAYNPTIQDIQAGNCSQP